MIFGELRSAAVLDQEIPDHLLHDINALPAGLVDNDPGTPLPRPGHVLRDKKVIMAAQVIQHSLFRLEFLLSLMTVFAVKSDGIVVGH